jgi:hypothetical protein
MTVRSRSANQICPPTTPWWRYLRRPRVVILFFPTVYQELCFPQKIELGVSGFQQSGLLPVIAIL